MTWHSTLSTFDICTGVSQISQNWVISPVKVGARAVPDTGGVNHLEPWSCSNEIWVKVKLGETCARLPPARQPAADFAIKCLRFHSRRRYSKIRNQAPGKPVYTSCLQRVVWTEKVIVYCELYRPPPTQWHTWISLRFCVMQRLRNCKGCRQCEGIRFSGFYYSECIGNGQHYYALHQSLVPPNGLTSINLIKTTGPTIYLMKAILFRCCEMRTIPTNKWILMDICLGNSPHLNTLISTSEDKKQFFVVSLSLPFLKFQFQKCIFGGQKHDVEFIIQHTRSKMKHNLVLSHRELASKCYLVLITLLCWPQILCDLGRPVPRPWPCLEGWGPVPGAGMRLRSNQIKLQLVTSKPGTRQHITAPKSG